MTELALSDNAILDITALSELKNLEYVSLWSNPIDDYSPVDHVDYVYE